MDAWMHGWIDGCMGAMYEGRPEEQKPSGK